MSTVIADSRTLTMAADKQMRAHATSVTKIFKVRDGAGEEWLVGGAGVLPTILNFINWFTSPAAIVAEADSPPMEDTGVLAMNSRGQVVFYSESAIPVVVEEPYFAIGSGADYAMGALDAGASIRRALSIATLRDPNTGKGATLLKLRRP